MATGLTARKLIRPEVDSHEMIVTEDYGLFIMTRPAPLVQSHRKSQWKLTCVGPNSLTRTTTPAREKK